MRGAPAAGSGSSAGPHGWDLGTCLGLLQVLADGSAGSVLEQKAPHLSSGLGLCICPWPQPQPPSSTRQDPLSAASAPLPLRGSEVRPYFDGLVGLGSGLVGVGGCGFGASTRRADSCAVQDQLSS